MRQGSFVWYELMTDAPDEVQAFYKGVLGWTIDGAAPTSDETPIDYRHIRRADGVDQGGVLVLTADMVEGGATPGWVPYLLVDDVDATVAAIVANGGESLMPTASIPEGTFAMVTDPGGAPFYLMTPGARDDTTAPPPPVFAMDMVGAAAWNELVTDDVDAALGFYSRHFGFSDSGTMPMGPMGNYVFLAHATQGPVGAMMPRLSPDMPGGWRIYFRVADIHAAAQAVTALGGTCLGEISPVPGGGLIVHVLDPAGAFLGLVGMPASAH